jgi:ABC-type glycerol-3-phosphate transport system substrate-binding protein
MLAAARSAALRRLPTFRSERKETVVVTETSAKTYSRRDALRLGGGGLLILYIGAGCGGGGGEAGGGTDVDVTWDLTYAGIPGGMKKYWTEIRDRLAKSDEGVRIGNLTGVDVLDLEQRLLAAHTAKKGSVIEPWFPDYSTYRFFADGSLEPLDEYVGTEEIENWLFGRKLKGKWYNMPFLAEQATLVGNSAHLQKAGVEYDGRFESWDDFVAALRSLKAAGITPVQTGLSDVLQVDKWAQASSMEFMDRQSDLTRAALGDLSVDEPVVSGWIDHLAELRDDGLLNEDATKLSEQQGVERFLQGEGGFMLMNPGPVLDPNVDGFEIAGYWKGDGAQSAPVAVAGTCLQMTSYGENKEAAGKLLTFTQQPEQLALFNELTREFPCNRRFDASNLPEVSQSLWDMIRSADPEPIWPHGFMAPEQVSAVWELGQKLVAGADPEDIRKEYGTRLETFRDRNKPGVEVLQGFLTLMEEEDL